MFQRVPCPLNRLRNISQFKLVCQKVADLLTNTVLNNFANHSLNTLPEQEQNVVDLVTAVFLQGGS